MAGGVASKSAVYCGVACLVKVFLTAFGLHNPCVCPQLQEHNAIPIAIDAIDGLDLDYSSLLIAEGFIIDRTSFDFVKERRRRFLGPMQHSLEVLQSEGLLEVADFGEITAPYREKVESMSSQLLEDVKPWITIARSQWIQLRPELEEFQRLYGLPHRAAFDTAHYGVVSYLERRDGHVDPVESARLHNLLESKRNRLKLSELSDLREVLKPLIAQVLINDLLRQKFKVPFIDWDDAQGFYDRLHLGQWTELEQTAMPDSAMADQARRLFQIVIPELLPQRIEDIVKFIHNNRAVRSLRTELWMLLRDGKNVTKEWMLQLHSETAKSDLRAKRRNRVIKWTGRIAGLFLPGADIAKDLILAGGEEVAESISNSNVKSRFEWYYALQRLKLDLEH